MDKRTLFEALKKDFVESHPKSQSAFARASGKLIGGGSHNLRLMDPFPFYDVRSSGAHVHDLDGFRYVDFWQGHFSNILGHNPPQVIDALMEYMRDGQGLLTGFPGIHQVELADIILKQLGAEKIRFTTSGTLASMYAIMMAKSFTKRELVMKIGGGWHGAQPYTLKGISAYAEGLSLMESAGLPGKMDSAILVTRFNDAQDLEDKFASYGDRIACLIIEPFMAAGGFIFAKKNYLNLAGKLALKHGSLLIMDEVVSGFRFHPGGLQSLYDIQADLSVLGKAIGGGLPVSAVAGRADVMSLTGHAAAWENRVKFDGGTFSAHPMSMLAGRVYLDHLVSNSDQIYPRIGRLGNRVRSEIETIFRSHGFNVRCTGENEGITEGSSLVGVHFCRRDVDSISSPEQVWNSEISDFDMREKIFKLAMLREGFNTYHGYGGISAAHSDEEIQASLDAVERIAGTWKTAGLKY
jgi:glutamate-1-semialdehyde 2,1-aminomutase